MSSLVRLSGSTGAFSMISCTVCNNFVCSLETDFGFWIYEFSIWIWMKINSVSTVDFVSLPWIEGIKDPQASLSDTVTNSGGLFESEEDDDEEDEVENEQTLYERYI